MTFDYDIAKKSIIDHSGKRVPVVDVIAEAFGTNDLTRTSKKLRVEKKKEKKKKKEKMSALGYKAYIKSVPWKHDFKNNCVKCNRAYHLQRHHITYNPSLTVFLCETCHSRITGINTRAAEIADTSLYHKLNYTNRIRVILWRWFMDNPWPKKDNKSVRRLSKTIIRQILSKHELNPSSQNLSKAEEQLNKSQEISCLTLSSSSKVQRCG